MTDKTFELKEELQISVSWGIAKLFIYQRTVALCPGEYENPRQYLDLLLRQYRDHVT